MAIGTTLALLENNENILGYYQEAKRVWEKIWADPKSETVEGLAEELSFHQISSFEQHCGGRWLGQEVMVHSGFMLLYDEGAGFDGNEEKVTRLKEAFQKAHLSGEVHSRAERLAKELYI
ncbi:hypothetical protein BCSAG_48320 [Bacillus cereus]